MTSFPADPPLEGRWVPQVPRTPVASLAPPRVLRVGLRLRAF